MLQQAKKVTNKIQEREKKSTKTADLTGEGTWHFPTYATIFFGISWFYDQKIYHAVFIIVVFSGLLVAKGGTVRVNRVGSSKVKITSTCLKAFQGIMRLTKFLLQNTEDI